MCGLRSYKGKKGGRPVAIKKMRVGLIDKVGYAAFCSEVIMLAQLDHENVVRLVGYCRLVSVPGKPREFTAQI